MIAIHRQRAALTLMELVVVLVILIALAGIVVPLLPNVANDASSTATLSNMQNVKNAIAAYYLDMKGIAVQTTGYPSTIAAVGFGAQGNTTGYPLTLKDLVVAPKDLNGNTITFDPITRRGWRGPYLTGTIGTFNYNSSLGVVLDNSFQAYGVQNDATIYDGYSRPIVIQWVTADATGTWVRLVSAGLNGVLNTPSTTMDLSATATPWQLSQDDTVIYLGKPLSFTPVRQ